MLKRILAIGFTIMGTSAHAYDSEAAAAEYDKSYLKVEECFESDSINREACVISGIQECVKDLEEVLESKGLYIPGGAAVSPHEYCNYIGLERADEHLNAVYQRIMNQGPLGSQDEAGIDEEGVADLRAAQRLWLQFANEMCSEDNIVGWHKGGSGWGAVLAECTTRLSIQQAENLDRFFTIGN
ncbi:lysozyme inhibitor LprI family protein [Ruegeria sp. HKCCD6119]|uniref:lysozyme inhibitor LprI family protein n=1 Tax=Ruegeria sp. HKCCD6119 TaxID=2683003 RepID=UPI00149254C1|nr:lysozyme inhibitor LprI family protein [Ruegeria sp. HKCCD6119]NOD86593.1 DUF1311 domain-containing protein [Ruegeria sp. HKCCD6119]